MGMFSFIKEAGEKLFGRKEVEDAAAASPSLDDLNTKAAHAIGDYIGTQNLGVSGLFVLFDGASGKVTVQSEAPTQEASEKVTLCCGNAGKYMLIFEANKPMLSNPDKIYPGQKLRIPAAA